MMQLSPAAVRAMTLPAFRAALDGFLKFWAIDGGESVSDDEFLDTLAREHAAGRA